MKKILIIVSATILILVALGFIFKGPLIEVAKDFVTTDMFVTEDTDDFSPGLNIGDMFPQINASYDGVQVNSLNAFAGQKGTIFVVSRSIDWCPFCMKQMIQLNENLNAFELAGLKVVGLTYDKPEAQQPFKDKYSLAYPILSDNDAATVISLGILNEAYSPGEEAYGIGHPGAYIIDQNGVIVGKVFVEAYSTRVDALSLLKLANNLLY